MKTIHFLDWPEKRYYGETHVFHRWKIELASSGIELVFYDDHRHPGLLQATCLIIHSRYFAAWQNPVTRNNQNQEELLNFLCRCKASVDQLIWFDAADSSGSADLVLLPYVDIMLKKQLLRDKNYYLGNTGDRSLRIWLPPVQEHQVSAFDPAEQAQLSKLRLGWNIGMNDYRYFASKMSRLSNYLPYKYYPLNFTAADRNRPLDVVFRGTVPQGSASKNEVAQQRNQVLKIFNGMQRKIPIGPTVSKKAYWKELRNAKLGVSPYGWGEICYRDFEIFIAGGLLVKPDMSHLESYPNFFISNKTYVPLRWDLQDLQERLEMLLDDYPSYVSLARQAQEHYRKVIFDAETFITHFKAVTS